VTVVIGCAVPVVMFGANIHFVVCLLCLVISAPRCFCLNAPGTSVYGVYFYLVVCPYFGIVFRACEANSFFLYIHVRLGLGLAKNIVMMNVHLTLISVGTLSHQIMKHHNI